MVYILEPGCGDGRFIIEIIKRIINKFDTDFEKINDRISKIYGIELDDINFEKLLITMDYDTGTYNGIKKINAIDWLLNK
jgi:hypothetical protein